MEPSSKVYLWKIGPVHTSVGQPSISQLYKVSNHSVALWGYHVV
ncbi:SLC2A1 isoform 8 [Pan troglodytes]|uniref:Solute carrier family 2 member 1 n=5 Tax=Hominoidea TaxID=314295 RepID=A0A1W2PQ59_HUMAN|nr:SLC2A1 isoform 8 [Pan troglodytes]